MQMFCAFTNVFTHMVFRQPTANPKPNTSVHIKTEVAHMFMHIL